jgi:phosphoribosylamine-glycine ligase
LDILVVGSGGREHAMCWALSKSKRKPKLYCAPGNAGIAQLAECLDILADDIPALVKWANEHDPNLIIIGPEVPLCMGLADELVEGRFPGLWARPKMEPKWKGAKISPRRFSWKITYPHRKSPAPLPTIKRLWLMLRSQGGSDCD